jgi:hypothetical protein
MELESEDDGTPFQTYPSYSTAIHCIPGSVVKGESFPVQHTQSVQLYQTLQCIVHGIRQLLSAIGTEFPAQMFLPARAE